MPIHYSKHFSKQFKKYQRSTQERIRKAILEIPKGDIVKIKGDKDLPPLYRLRIGTFRVLFRMSETDIFIEWLDSRGDIYKRM